LIKRGKTRLSAEEKRKNKKTGYMSYSSIGLKNIGGPTQRGFEKKEEK